MGWKTYLETDFDKDSDIEIDEVKTNSNQKEKTKSFNLKQLKSSSDDVVCLSSEDEKEETPTSVYKNQNVHGICYDSSKKNRRKSKRSVRFGMDALKVRLQFRLFMRNMKASESVVDIPVTEK